MSNQEPPTLDELMDRLKRMGDVSTAEEFIRRIETMTIMYAFMCKRFKERFPMEFAEWDKD